MNPGPTCVESALPNAQPRSTSPGVEFRHTIAREYSFNPPLTHVSLLSNDFLAAVAYLPDTTPITECTHSVDDLIHNCKNERDKLRQTFNTALLERDRVYMRALAEITQILNQHSLSIYEIDNKLQPRET
jgi:hypothetical protein